MDNTSLSSWRYKIELTYLDLKRGKSIEIKNECLKYLVVDHNYKDNCMPIIYATIALDKALLDDMILNINNNLITVAVYKYDELMDHVLDIECFRKKFTYFLPDDINKTEQIDYNDEFKEQNLGDTYRQISLGLLCIDHVNNNKRSMELNIKNTTINSAVRHLTSHFNDIVIEPFTYNETIDQLIMPPMDSVNKALEYLNNYKVFYNTPYRYYQDFNCAYILSSGGYAVPRKDDKYNSVLFDIKEILDPEANDIGMITNKTKHNYRITVNSLDTTVYDNTISNKSKNMIRGISSSGTSLKALNNNAIYSDIKINNIRLNNDNIHMIENIESQNNSSIIFINLYKADLDTNAITINKRYSIYNIEKYYEYNGDYILNRKREMYVREDDTFKMNMILNLRKFE